MLGSPTTGKSSDKQANNTAFLTIDSKTTSKLYHFASKNSDVEFGRIVTETPKGNTVGAVVTSHEAAVNRAINDLEYSLTFGNNSLTIKQVDHSHPQTDYNVEYPSGFNEDGTIRPLSGDRQNAAYYERYHQASRTIYVPATGKYIEFNSKRFKK